MDVKYICLWIIGVVAIPPFKYTTAMVFSKIQSFSILIFFPKEISNGNFYRELKQRSIDLPPY